MNKDSPVRAVGISLLIALICSVVVTAATTYFRPYQRNHKLVDYNRDLLRAVGHSDMASADAHTLARAVEDLPLQYIDLDQATAVALPMRADNVFEQALETDRRRTIAKAQDLAQLGSRPIIMPVYRSGQTPAESRLIVPAYGQGMWSTIQVFIVLSADADRIVNVVIHEHAETPGIGDRIEDPRWLAGFDGLPISSDHVPLIRLNRGPPADDDSNRIDLISGATVSSERLVALINYWLGPDAFGPYLKRLASDASAAT